VLRSVDPAIAGGRYCPNNFTHHHNIVKWRRLRAGSKLTGRLRTRTSISVNYPSGDYTVEDNGLGILLSEFKPDGSLGKLYCTEILVYG
jgi:hypothetical protein